MMLLTINAGHCGHKVKIMGLNLTKNEFLMIIIYGSDAKAFVFQTTDPQTLY